MQEKTICSSWLKGFMAEKYLLWDFGRTLSNHGAVWSESVVTAINQAHPEKNVTRAQIKSFFAKGFPWHTPEIAHDHIKTADQWWLELMQPILNRVFTALEIPESEFASLLRVARQECLDPKRWTLYDDIIPTLEKLSSLGWKHVILSNHVPELESVIEKLEIRHFFEHVFTSGIVGFEKPNPRFFDFALSRIGAENQIIMIGDNPEHDIEGAAQFGIPGILVRDGENGAREWILDDLVANSLLELLT
jgi:putative hydrolase of the HAD superfamily